MTYEKALERTLATTPKHILDKYTKKLEIMKNAEPKIIKITDEMVEKLLGTITKEK